MSEEQKYTLAEMKNWLLGSSKEAIQWRTDSERTMEVNLMIEQFAATPGGLAGSVVWGQITRERDARAREIKAKVDEETWWKALESAIREDYIAGGGTRSSFKANRSKIVEQYALSGRSVGIVEKSIANRRSQAARTF